MAPQSPATPRFISTALQVLRRFGPLAFIAALAIAALASGVTRHLSLHELRTRREFLDGFVHAHPVLAVASYVGAYAILVALSLPIALVSTLTGGFLFGMWIGGAAAAAGCTLGAVIVFLVCRMAAGDALRSRGGPVAARIEAGIRRDAFSYIVMLRLIPITPFWLANLALGLIDIPLRTFAAATFIGILPVSLIYASLGAGLNRVFARGGHAHLHELLQPSIYAPLIALALLALTPIAWRRLRRPRGS
jgi:uncharacterized membrane protein YdjX (TVP38/TMEM64 family)